MTTNILLSHEQTAPSFEEAKGALIQKIQQRGDLHHASVETQIGLLNELAQFKFGQFLIERGGLNGFWTHYVVTHPNRERSEFLHSLEAYLLDSSPTCLATQQRFAIFKGQIQKRVQEGCTFASIPSGVMGDLLEIDYSGINQFSLQGIDLDPESLSLAQDLAKEKKLDSHCQFSKIDAWALEFTEKFDLIASNGLTIYETDDEKVVELYRKFYAALKPNGVLVTSFLTPIPEWKLDRIKLEDAKLQKIVFGDILNAKWQVYRKEVDVLAQLKKAGFDAVEIIYDNAHIFPTLVAKK